MRNKPELKSAEVRQLSTTNSNGRKFFVLGVMLMIAALAFPQTSRAATTTITSRTMIAATNRARVSLDRSRLRGSVTLQRAAMIRALEVARRGSLLHTTSSGNFFSAALGDRRQLFGALGENLAFGFGNPDAVVQAWLKSSIHRRNLLNSKFSHTGVAVIRGTVNGRTATIVVELFGQIRL